MISPKAESVLTNVETFNRGIFACAVFEDRHILVTGGLKRLHYRTLSSTAIVDVLAPTSDALLHLPKLPQQGGCKGAILDGYFYVISHNNMYRLSLSTFSEWELVNQRIEGCTYNVITNGKNLFILGQGEGLPSLISYDPFNDNRTILSSMLNPRYQFASTLVGNKIFIIGGYKHPETLSSVEVFDIATQSWSHAPPLPVPLFNATAVSIKRWIVVLGGYQYNYVISSRIFVFDLLKQTWSQSESTMLRPRVYHQSLTVGSNIMSIGGWDDKHHPCPTETIPIKLLLPIWEGVKHFILLRSLVHEGRAHPFIAIMTEKGHKKRLSHQDQILQTLIIRVNLDVFREVISFLI